MILVSNDDGIDAPGILALARALKRVDEVCVVAPERNWTATGHTKTLDRPLRIRELTLGTGRAAVKAFACDGSPSDAVAVGFLGLLEEPPRLVVSGINRGTNLGSDITYSGTVSAAMEGVVMGVPAIAVSLDRGWDAGVADYRYAASFAARLAARVMVEPVSDDVLLNVNVPGVPRTRVRGVKVVRLGGKRDYSPQLLKRDDPFGQPYYWISGKLPEASPPADTDVWAVENNYVSVTPILIDLTHDSLIEHVKAWKLKA